MIRTAALRKLADEFTPFRSILIRNEQVLLAQAQQSAASNASHLVEARMKKALANPEPSTHGPKRLIRHVRFMSAVGGPSRLDMLNQKFSGSDPEQA
jgi:hypothetical protein